MSLNWVWIVAIKFVRDIKDIFAHPVENLLWALGSWLVLILIAAVPSFLTTKYQMTDHEFILRKGIFRRRLLHINYAHIQTVQHSQWFFLKPFGVESLTLETAAHAGNEPEVKLVAVPIALVTELERRQEAARNMNTPTPTPTADAPVVQDIEASSEEAGFNALQQALARKHEAPKAAAETYHHTLSFGELMQFALTSLGFFSTILLLLAGFQYIDQIPGLDKWVESNFANMAAFTAIIGLIGLLAAGIIISLCVTLARYWHFTVNFDGTTVSTQKGLFQTNTVSAPTRRIQAVRFQQNIIRGWFHKGTAQVILASAVGKAEDDNDMVLYPMLPRVDVWARLHRVVDWLPSQQPQMRHFTTGRIALVRNAVWFPLIVACVIAYFGNQWGYIAFLWPLLSIGFGMFAAHARGIAISDRILFMNTGSMFVRSDFAVARNHVQSLEIKQSWWMEKTRQVHIVIHVRKGNGDEAITLKYVPEEVGQQVYTWYR